ncbi:MarR family transcriptional regulator [Nonomuraea muscovyensis]
MAALDTLLSGLAREHSTGALRVGRAGTIFLDEGRVTYMECAQTPGVERILAARGRMPEAALRRLQADGGSERLLAEGPVTLGELQYCVLGAVLDAAFFLLPSSGTRPKFRPGERHWLGGCWYFDVRGLVRECARRRAHLARIWPSADVDTAPVRPAPRLAGHGVTLSRVQWEVVTHADHELTPLELARRLGRSGYSVLQAVRELAAAGLLVPVPPGEDRPALPKRSRQAARARSGSEAGTRARPYQDSQPGAAPGPGAGPESAARADSGPGARFVGPAVTADPADLELLMRLKKALEELS